MSAQLADAVWFRLMRTSDLDRVIAIEERVYTHPWTRGNFADSLRAGYGCWTLECDGVVQGYGVLMTGVDEAHLLNLTIAAETQGRGYGRRLLAHFLGLARDLGARSIYLEVRPSNVIARDLYRRDGFREVGIRRGYYPALAGREDAIVMERRL
ncbi:MAG TPA: ribosomal protein S18-alanine N-acetyltransferase [Burkholderiales bacterium]|nr:ribosomal protein S18-alanine N-acetyltransferase [Burkholderiales bacterium]